MSIFSLGGKLNEIEMEDLKRYIAKNRSLDADEEIRSLITRVDPDIDVEPMFQNSLYVNPQVIKVNQNWNSLLENFMLDCRDSSQC